jgi:hypothetical protein
MDGADAWRRFDELIARLLPDPQVTEGNAGRGIGAAAVARGAMAVGRARGETRPSLVLVVTARSVARGVLVLALLIEALALALRLLSGWLLPAPVLAADGHR